MWIRFSDDAERRGDDRACRAGNPRPAILVRIEANVAIGRFKFPSPEPVPLFASRLQQPPQCFIAGVGFHLARSECRGREPLSMPPLSLLEKPAIPRLKAASSPRSELSKPRCHGWRTQAQDRPGRSLPHLLVLI